MAVEKDSCQSKGSAKAVLYAAGDAPVRTAADRLHESGFHSCASKHDELHRQVPYDFDMTHIGIESRIETVTTPLPHFSFSFLPISSTFFSGQQIFSVMPAQKVLHFCSTQPSSMEDRW